MLLTSLGAVLASKIVLGLLLGLGPLFIALLLFDATRGVFEGWLRASIGFALAPLLALLGLVVQLTLIGPDLARLAEARSQGLVDLAPANSIFLLTLISTGVSLALAIAVAVIATSLRLPKAFGRGAGAAAPTPLAAAVFTHQAHSAREVPSEPRALAVAAAATAMERREVRVDQADSGGPRRVVARAGRAETSAPALTLAPLGQTYRRTTAPRQAASNLRRDR
jgi:type IV secretion system protein VirB6